jgi:hypothetical protein
MTTFEFIKANPIAALLGFVIFFSFLFFPILLLVVPVIGWVYIYFTEDRTTKPKQPLSSTPQQTTLTNSRPIRGNRLMSTAERNAYLNSPQWQALRKLVIERDIVCQLTGDTTDLEVHHITYDNLSNEYLEDLVLLSRRAHQFVHDYYGSYDRNNTYPIEPLKGLIK